MSADDTVPVWFKEHIALYRTDPEKAHFWDSAVAGRTDGVIRTLLLTTTDASMGNEIYSPLIYGEDGVSCVVVASKGGAPGHPPWYLNLVKDPHCEVQVGLRHFKAVARTTEGAEREPFWAMMNTIYPHYADFQQRAGGGELPVVLLEPEA